MRLHGLEPAQFLRENWQKKPLLLRGAWPDWQNPVAPDDLAGLACEETMESRLVVQQGDALSVEHGPFDPGRFDTLGRSDWTLLVQGVDRIDPDVAAMIEPFRFIPDWRIDDVMVSFAAECGGVGAHFDAYDVFLVQGLGRRRWRIGQVCDADTPLLPHNDLKLLADFQPVAEYVLEPGDMLYVPPGIAHEGTALAGDGGGADEGCMTYSIGFRAPSDIELLADYTDDIVAESLAETRYTDPDLRCAINPGEIGEDAIDQMHAMVLARLQDRESFTQWLGANLSSGRHGPPDSDPDAVFHPATALMRNPESRFAYIAAGPDNVTLFVDGEAYECSGPCAEFAKRLCAASHGQLDDELLANAADRDLIEALLVSGALIPADDME
ncbi:50S ribosomal protein L16 3-hydroxylase [Alteripontixanthobacter maritimus]|uniref:50S ribosomal protein L16 3-hydroxylase n=1 Tax=Alteripontixanthobacter maritimus TaxID=2161824 RepID=A0A369Q6V2_9SPHN|nr:cupin domain-containing protein [Alteripontixanthobacter maritimus]RDC59027.1 50S ribosomal protein L16 3-hydroxylase [Alteripontixanthobacter maritimus]